MAFSKKDKILIKSLLQQLKGYTAFYPFS